MKASRWPANGLASAHNDRLAGNFAAAMFAQDTSRGLDPHLHTHCIIFNATFDAVENRWKALQNYELLRAKKFAENAYITRDCKVGLFVYDETEVVWLDDPCMLPSAAPTMREKERNWLT